MMMMMMMIEGNLLISEKLYLFLVDIINSPITILWEMTIIIVTAVETTNLTGLLQ
jgi:hypothetical protein